MEAGSHNMAVGLAAFDYLSYPTVSLLLNSLFLRRVSVFFHLSLLFGIFASWIRVKSKIVQDQMHAKRGRMLYYRLVLFIFVALCLYNFGLCGLNYFFWYGNGWPEEKLVNMVDLLVRGFVSLACFIYLYTQFPTSGASRFPLILRVWWAFYVLISFYCLIIDWVENRKTNSLPVQFMVSDLIFAISSLVFCYAGLFGKRLKETVSLTEPLLNGNSASLPVEGLLNNSSSTENESSPYGNASFLSILTFTWVSRVISRGYKKALDIEDVPELAGADSVNGSYPIFKQSIESSMEGCGSSCKLSTLQLVKSLISTTWVDIMVTGLLALLNTCASYVGPYLIDTFVQYLNGNREYKSEGFALVSAFFFAKVIECFSQRHWFFRAQRAGLRARSVLVAMIYKKGLTLSGNSKQGQTSGEIINFMSVDAQRVGDFAWYMHDPWMVLLQVFLALLILFRNLGLASIAAFVVILLLMLANYPLSTKLEKFQDNLMQCKDRRMKATSEILKNMRILKLQAWEMKFLSKISQLRENEAGWLKKYLYTKAVLSFVFWSTPTFVSVVTFGTCIIMGIPLESGKILSALATFRILQEPIYSLPDTVSVVIQTKVSLDRLASFLSLADLQFDAVEVLPRECSVNAVEIIDGNFTWDDSSLAADSISLKDVNLSVSHGMRVAICGTVGSGKSSLLSCILGEMPKLSGMLRVSGSKAYVAQSAWIQSGKIVDNILFGKEMDCERYEMVLQACSLKKDLEVLSFGDQTVIGERGINLSGGQKQRIQIARALYQDADIYLFDDPFSAVDAHTGTHLFKECLLGYLSSKTVIYVTHQVEFLPAADLILVMKDGKISQAGKYSDILTSGSDFKELVGAHEKALSVLDSDNNTEEVCSNEDEKLQFVLDDGVTNSDISRVSCTEVDKSCETAEDQQLVQEEEREKGKVGWSVYWKYITTAYNGALVPVILLLQVLFQVLQIGSNYWIAWATPVSSDVKANVRGTTLIEVYSGLAAGSAFCILIRAILIATTAYKTATILFSKMHLSIFRAPMSFFDATPSGRILNRASTDQSAVDLNIPYQVASSAFTMIQLLGIIAVMSQVAWQVFVIFIPITAISIWYQQYYLPSARELSRLVGVCKAPVIQHFAETISGGTTIRSFGQQSRFWDTSMKLIDAYSRPNFYIAGAMEWLCIRLDLLSSVTFACSLIFLISVPVGGIDPAIAGLAVTYGLNLNMIQAWVIWNLCQLENKIISVERILQYTKIESEPPLLVEENRPDPSWPSLGEVNICSLEVRYAPHMPLVLRGITCTFQGQNKCGIVGRTGSGKSTLIQALFRIVEPTRGRIIIDGVDISAIGLHDLRSRLSIIPQEPTMFEGTVRSNLDPLEEFTDDQIWDVLDKCQLGDEVRGKEKKLDSVVAENGENWSMGQRQLVCLGRVLLKKSKILVLDEATASVDTATDNLIQHTLRHHFEDSTVLIIAHRITSVLDSDMVLVLDQGLVQECDAPSSLLQDKSSSFAKLVAEYTARSKSNHC